MPHDMGPMIEFSPFFSRFLFSSMNRLLSRSGLVPPLLALALLTGCEQPPLLERVKTRGVLRIATVAGPLSCYLDEKGPAGLEYELARRFAHTFAVKADFKVFPTRLAALEALKRGEVQMVAAARQPSSLDRKHTLAKPPHDPVVVPTGSLQHELLQAMASAFPAEALPDRSEEAILEEVNQGSLSHTLVNRALLRAWRSLYPSLVQGRELSEPRGFHWFFSRRHDSSLAEAASRFLEKQQSDGKLQKLLQRYITKLPGRNFVTLRDFWKHVKERLPRYEELFREAGKATGIDWRLLAAVGYQESHWQPTAVSPTGVRGIMMLTRDAARKEKIGNRMDPAQSIAGGARHLRWMEKRIPERIQEPDRLWLTLASYSTVKHGKARGGEPVVYVENIRYYYRLLVWWDNRRRGLDCTSSSYPRLALKKARSNSPQLSASTPPSTAVK